MFDFRIKTFLVVCETLNYTKAAKQLNLTQPAVTQHIHYLEKEYGVTLFFLRGKQIQMTSEAIILQQVAIRFQNDEKIMREQLQNSKEKRKSLLIGATVTIGEFVLMDPLAEFMRNHPDIDVHVTITNTSELLQKLKHGVLQFAVVEGYFEQKEFDSMLLKTERFIPVCHANYPLKDNILELKNLFLEPLLLREEGSGTREIFEKSLHMRNHHLYEFEKHMEINSMHAIVQLLLQQCGISFLYEAAVGNELREKELKEIKIKDYNIRHDFSFIWNKGSIYTIEYQKICNEIKKYVR